MAKCIRGLLGMALFLATAQTYAESSVPAEPTVAPSVAGALRDPFWPIDYQPKPTAAQAAAQTKEEPQGLLDLSKLSPEEQEIIKSNMRVGGIMQQKNECIAIINKAVVREGETMQIPVRGKVYRFLIRTLQAGNIVLEPVELEVDGQNQK